MLLFEVPVIIKKNRCFLGEEHFIEIHQEQGFIRLQEKNIMRSFLFKLFLFRGWLLGKKIVNLHPVLK